LVIESTILDASPTIFLPNGDRAAARYVSPLQSLDLPKLPKLPKLPNPPGSAPAFENVNSRSCVRSVE
jgi:hypothetical protein